MLKVGDRVKVTDGKKVRKGIIIYEKDCFYTVQFKSYKECFNKTDVNNGNIVIEHL